MNLLLAFPLLIAFFVTFLVLPTWIKRAKRFGLVGRDVNKYDKPEVAEAGGVAVIAGFILAVLFYIAIRTFYFNSNEKLIEIFALSTSVLMLAGIGIIDGLLGWRVGLRRRTRVILCLFASIPLMVINAGHSDISLPLIGWVDLGLLYPLLLIPIGITSAATTFNFLAGYNGLEAGLGALILSALSIVAYFTGNSWLSLIGLCMVFSLIAFLIFNKYPAEVFPGDVLTYPVGGLIAILAILGNFEKIAVFFFIPYIIEVCLKLRGKLINQSFGKPKKDGSLELAYDKVYSLNHLAILFLKKMKKDKKAYEREVVISICIFQIAVIILGFILFRGYIF